MLPYFITIAAESLKSLLNKKWLLISAGWLALGFYFILSSFVYYADSTQTFNWESHLINRLPPYLVWALLTPIIYNIVIKFRPDKNILLKNILILSLIGIFVSIIHRLISVSSSYVLFSVGGSTTEGLFTVLAESKFVIFSYLFDSFFTYWVLVIAIFSFDYYKKFNENRIKTAELESRLSQVELKALRMQLQPHFLFNTLNSISALIHKNPEAADLMLTRLSDLLRFTLDKSSKQKVSLDEEMEFISAYLDIQKIRYGDRLKIEFDIPEETKHIEVPALILQPTVENSIIHSVEKRNEPTRLSIKSELNNGSLTIMIEDDGPGLTQHYVEGIGLQNTRIRLQQFYGNKSFFKIANTSKGVSTIITIPADNQ